VLFRSKENKQEGNDPENALERYLSRNKSKLSDQLKNLWDEQFYLRYDNFDPNKDYYYYPMHMEPEAVVLYWGDGIYKNQIKLIENIAAQLPPNCFLYVKVHPIVKEERHFIDYKRIKAIPNVKLLGSAVSGKLIISKCKGLLTINGTSGFEAVLLNKPVYVFGNSFYDLSNRVFKIKNIRDLREILYKNHNQILKDDEPLFRFILAYLEISHLGYTSYYSNYRELLKIDNNKNVEEVSIGIKEYFT
jgi:capsule polysaccharide modification protein KpsS